jgi:hypothetical protein
MEGSLMGIIVGVWMSPLAVAAAVLAVVLGSRAPWWVLLAAVAVLAACAILAVAGALWLTRRIERHAARAWAQRPAGLRAQVPPAERRPIGPVYNFNLYGPAADQAAVIRNAITGGNDGPAEEPGGRSSPAAARPAGHRGELPR